jgi:hypothetical protein
MSATCTPTHQAVPIMLPTVALNDVDAADSPYAMTLRFVCAVCAVQ